MSANDDMTVARCHDCGSDRLRLLPGSEAVGRVTSDCQPWPAGARLAACGSCALVQTLVTPAWQRECEQIYQRYEIYHQSGGIEQPVFQAGSGANQARSDAILRGFRELPGLPERGRWLDIGCGNGALLRACSRVLPGWRLCGSEVGDKYRREVEAIPGVEALFTQGLENLEGDFDVISLVHVLEHIPHPRAFLASLAPRLRAGGRLLVQVPDCLQNAFMLVVADHCSHFADATLARVVSAAGFQVLVHGSRWVPKELSLVAQPTGVPAPGGGEPAWEEADRVLDGWETLRRVLTEAGARSRRANFGIFGTSIGATWLDAELGATARFFVDEDPSRVGRHHRERPILSPAQVPAGAVVYLALPAVVSQPLRERLQVLRPEVEFLAP